MRTSINWIIAGALTLGAFSGAALAQDNSRYGETRIGELPNQGVSSHRLWVGSWWSYSSNGIANRHKLGFGDFSEECGDVEGDAAPQQLIDDGNAFCLSAAEKIDYLMGRIGDIDWQAIQTYQEVAQGELGTLQEEIRDLVPALNAWIAENPGGAWRETEDGIKYLELQEQLETAEEALPEIDIDTATEFEHINHGNGVPGVGSWWGHCNAWAAAATATDEPLYRSTIEHNGVSVDVTPGEVKALVTEAYMEHRSDFYGSRHNGKENEGVRYDDVTAAGFHIYFATQLGQRSRAFVIDRFTGSQVWNQAVLGYNANVEAAYTTGEDGTAAAERVDIALTVYDRFSGEPSVSQLGEKDVYPVSVTTTIYWMTDGLPHEAETAENILALQDMDPADWPTSSSGVTAIWGDQVHSRTLSYTLWLDAPLTDENARILGDGQWNHASEGSDHAHPDFLWSSLGQAPSRRDYENPYIEYTSIVEAIMQPASLVAPTTDEPGEEPTTTTTEVAVASDTAVEIPDDNGDGITSVLSVTDEGNLVSGTATVNITHTWRGDLKVVLSHDGRTATLHNESGGSANDLNLTFDLTEFVGTVASGEWTLSVSDNAAYDLGTLDDWSLALTVEQ